MTTGNDATPPGLRGAIAVMHVSDKNVTVGDVAKVGLPKFSMLLGTPKVMVAPSLIFDLKKLMPKIVMTKPPFVTPNAGMNDAIEKSVALTS